MFYIKHKLSFLGYTFGFEVQWNLYKADTNRSEKKCPPALTKCPLYREFGYDFQQEKENQYNQSTSFSTIEVLLKDINQHIPIILIKEDTFTINCFVRGYHAYMDIWAPKAGNSDLEITPEEKSERDKFAVAIYHDKRFVGHDPKNLSKPFDQFMSLPRCSISCEVTGKRVNGGYGL